MIITQDHIEYIIKLFSQIDTNITLNTGASDIKLILAVFSSIDVRRKGKYTNSSYVLDTVKEQLVVEDDV